MPQKLERPTPSGVNWDVHRFEFEDGSSSSSATSVHP
jgi:hypothetical protein